MSARSAARWSGWRLFGAFLLGLSAAVVVYGYVSRYSAFYEDARSHSVMTRDFFGFFSAGETMLVRMPGFDAGKAEWRRGVKTGFGRTLGEGETFAYRRDGEPALVTFVKLNGHRIKYRFLLPDSPVWVDAEADDPMPMQFGTGSVRWSRHQDRSVYLYANPWFLMPERTFVIAYPVDATSLTDFASPSWSQIRFVSYPWE